MMRLACAFVGKMGAAFPIVIAESAMVGELQQAIKRANPNKVRGDASELVLFLATSDEKTWLPSGNDAVVQMRSGTIPALIEMIVADESKCLDSLKTLAEVFHGKPRPTTGELHLLVDVQVSCVDEKRKRAPH